ncbi:MAG: flagellar basal-body MS-ring/collar protein FliF [Rhodocyclaceae bacterium]|nr:flagellar basal-body MS-ring/collar protein FliF [Rhodocyclaceae bacterium]
MAETTSAVLPFLPAQWTQLSNRQKLGLLGGIALALALIVAAWLWLRAPSYGVLFSNLSEADGGQIVAALEQQNIPYKLGHGGSSILVPAERVHDLRLRLAAQGLPKGGLVGFEVMENQKLGISQFAEQINYQRALEGELSRTIQTLSAVRAARVHLAIPKQTAFLRDEIKPSASVVVGLQPGRTLDPIQIAGIVHLVSSSVPQLSPANVSIIDQDGKLLSPAPDKNRLAGLDASQIAYVRDLEKRYLERVDDLLVALVGKDNFRAQLTADVDFSHVEQVEESYQPNPAPKTAIRSQQTQESGSGNPPAMGVPGALTNQPPVPATAPLTAPPVASAGATGTAAGNYSRNATINYELDKTVRHVRGVPGSIKRLSLAIVVNHRPGPPGKDGKPGKPVPPSAEELKRIEELAKQAVGFDEKRGDTISVAAAPLTPKEAETLPELPLWKDPFVLAFAKDVGQYLLLGLLALLLWFKLVKPLLSMAQPPGEREKAEEEAVAAAEEKAPQTGEQPLVKSFEDRLKEARELAQKEPKLVAELIKEWMGANANA